MITEDYVSFETAKLLKEKGFDEECACFYSDYDYGVPGLEYDSSITCINSWLDDEEYAAPTLQMAMKWLRDVHNLWCEISWEGKGLWCMEVFSLMNEEFMPGSIVHEIKSYEEACEAAIKYCLEKLI